MLEFCMPTLLLQVFCFFFLLLLFIMVNNNVHRYHLISLFDDYLYSDKVVKNLSVLNSLDVMCNDISFNAV